MPYLKTAQGEVIPVDKAPASKKEADVMIEQYNLLNKPNIPEGKQPSIAVQNNNPGNLRGLEIPYQGKSGIAETKSGQFSKFDSPVYGMRALARDINVKINRGLNTIDKLISVYSPDGDTYNQVRGHHSQAYIDYVSMKTGIPVDKELSNKDRFKLIKAITNFESGYQPWSDELIQAGIDKAGWKGKSNGK